MTLPCPLHLFHTHLPVAFTSDPLPFHFSAVGHSQTLDPSEHIAASQLVELSRRNVVPEPNCECPELKPHSCLKLSLPLSGHTPPFYSALG